MNRKTYKGIPVNKVDVSEIISECQRRGLGEVCVGLDISKHDLYAVFHHAAGSFSQPIRVPQPAEIGAFVALLSRIQESLPVKVGLESTGVYLKTLLNKADMLGMRPNLISGEAVAHCRQMTHHQQVHLHDRAYNLHVTKPFVFQSSVHGQEVCSLCISKSRTYEHRHSA